MNGGREMTEYIQVFTTTDTKESAEKIATELVTKRLAACTQVIGPLTSNYRWEGQLEKSEEWLCIIKTRMAKYTEVERFIKKIHGYDVPEILALPVVAGNQAYLEWLDQEVEP
jgi:periplasmic divalent cation tolerance protein